MANYVKGKPNALIDLMAPRTTRQKYDSWFANMDKHGEDPKYYNRIFGEIENELPFKDDVEHDKWSQMWESYMGEPEVENFTNAILDRLEEGYPGTDEAESIANKYFSTRSGGYKPNPNMFKNDYDLFNAIHYSPSKYGRDNYVKGEEEEIWNELNKYFDLPKFNPYMYSFGVNDKDKTVNLFRNGVYDTVNKSGWLRKPLDYGPLKRRK